MALSSEEAPGLPPNIQALVWGTLLALAIVALVTVTHPPDGLWDVSNGHRTMIGRHGNTTPLQLLVKIAGEAAKVFFLPVLGYVGAALVAGARRRPVQVGWLLWTLWAVSILGWLWLGDWWGMDD